MKRATRKKSDIDIALKNVSEKTGIDTEQLREWFDKFVEYSRDTAKKYYDRHYGVLDSTKWDLDDRKITLPHLGTLSMMPSEVNQLYHYDTGVEYNRKEAVKKFYKHLGYGNKESKKD